MKRRIKSGAAMAGAAVIAGLGLTAGPAQAEGEFETEFMAGGCASGYVCGWQDTDYDGDKLVNWRVGGVGTTYEIGRSGDNAISSISNESSRALRLYANDGATGAYFCLGAGADVRNLSGLEPSRNNWIESIRVVSAC
ncbi:peptidase inhibitor family I36 protein [Glycomyces tritici]|uniref:Peptidase inhibitor family I36 protein n=1 Tax=Glycomyces tritici TaxID=2665176 RepID=A0ABT7YTE1_9ACTN|nr:peptidase inhibitor family I36 protein [Glycomyces tritici]MDN3241917.1 peptidase inhibitor family I36 protein [Glycomyces tritici]